MSNLPLDPPAWRVFAANAVVIGVLGFLWWAYVTWGGWRFAAGFIVGLTFVMVAVRMRYGFWPFDEHKIVRGPSPPAATAERR